jgi:hypothetical protein
LIDICFKVFPELLLVKEDRVRVPSDELVDRQALDHRWPSDTFHPTVDENGLILLAASRLLGFLGACEFSLSLRV